MRKIRVFAHISLDGVISPGGRNDDGDYAHGGWRVFAASSQRTAPT